MSRLSFKIFALIGDHYEFFIVLGYFRIFAEMIINQPIL